MRAWGLILWIAIAVRATGQIPVVVIPSEVTVDLNSFSDYLAASSLYVLNIRIEGEKAHARLIKIGGLGREICGGVLVHGEEAEVPTSQLRPILQKADLCDRRRNAGNIFGPTRASGHFEAAKPGIMATCAVEQTTLRVPWDYEMRKPRGRAATLFNLYWDLRGAAFGKAPLFVENNSIEQQRRALPWIEELKSGRFDAGFAGIHLAERLGGYRGVLGRDDIPTVVVKEGRFQFRKFTQPIYPPLARAARVRGSILLRIPFDTETGLAGQPELVSGPPLLVAAAIKAAQEWQFDSSGLASPVTVEIRYGLDCSE